MRGRRRQFRSLVPAHSAVSMGEALVLSGITVANPFSSIVYTYAVPYPTCRLHTISSCSPPLLLALNEMGALPRFHDAVFTPPVQIEVPEFLTTFFKISSVAKRLAARSDSAAKLIEYRGALKVGEPATHDQLAFSSYSYIYTSNILFYARGGS